MTRFIHPKRSQSNPNADVTTESPRPSRGHFDRRAPAERGTSCYLGRKAVDFSARAKRLGRFQEGAAQAMLDPDARSTRDLEAPRLYHGLPSAMDPSAPLDLQGIDGELEDEILRLEGHLRSQVRTQDGPSAVPRSGQDEPSVPSGARVNPAPERPQSGKTERAARWDDFGRDQRALERFSGIAGFLTQRYFRTVVTGVEHVPTSGPCLLVANHSGAFPWDGLIVKSAIWAAHPERRHLRWLTEDFVQGLPFVGTALQRLGAVRASRENVLHLLNDGECVLAFPEGVKGYAKPRPQWYRVQRLGRGRIVSLCLQAKVPLLPCAVVGGEESAPTLRRLEAAERWLQMPYFPITPTFPWLGPAGILPGPARWHIDIGPPFLTGQESTRAEDPLYLAELTSRLRATLQERVDGLLARRKSAWFG